MDYVLGIDLGTTYSTVSAVNLADGKVQVLANREGKVLTPSAVYFGEAPGVYLVGEKAKNESAKDPRNLVMFVKREIGKTADQVRWDPEERRPLPYFFWNKTFSPEDISSMILRQLKEDAEQELNATVTKAVITCPAYFTGREKEATKEAGILAGLDVIEILPEPTAAAVTYGALKGQDLETIFVFDLGGGTFDVSILKVAQGPQGKQIKMIGTDGNRKLGGKDWDDYLISFVLGEFRKKTGIRLNFEEGPEKDRAIGKLRLDVEKAKIQLSQLPSVKISVSYGGASHDIELTAEKYADLTASLVEECKAYCNNAIMDAGLTWGQIDSVVMVGSMSNSPPLKKALAEWSGKSVKSEAVNKKTCVSEGAAMKAYLLMGGRELNIIDNALLVLDPPPGPAQPRPEPIWIPTEPTTTTSIISSSLGIVAWNRQGESVVDRLIPKHSEYPVSVRKVYPLSSDNQLKLEIKILEGESKKPEECSLLGTVTMNLNGRLAKGDRIEVVLSLDSSQSLQVSATDLKTGTQVDAKIKKDGSATRQ